MIYKKQKTYQAKPTEIKTQWYLIDARDQPLGRLATQISRLLVGKHKVNYTYHLNSGDWVIVINSDQVILTGNKNQEKTYYSHSGYPGNLKAKTASQIRAVNSGVLIEKAVYGMLPKNKLRRLRLKRLKIYSGSDHPHAAQKPKLYPLKN